MNNTFFDLCDLTQRTMYRSGVMLSTLQTLKKTTEFVLTGFRTRDEATEHAKLMSDTDQLYTPEGFPYTAEALEQAIELDKEMNWNILRAE